MSVSTELLDAAAVQLRQFGRFDEAIEALERAVALDETDPDLWRELGFAFRKKGEPFFDRAEGCFTKALELNDADAELHGMVGGLLKRRGALRDALKHYRRAYELEPENLYPMVNLASMASATSDMSESQKWYALVQSTCEGLIMQHEADGWTYLCLGEASFATGDEEQAIEAYRKAIEFGAAPEDVKSAMEQLGFLADHGFRADSAARIRSQMDQPS